MHDVYPVTESPAPDGITKLTGTEDLTKRPLHRTKKSSGVHGPAGSQGLKRQRRYTGGTSKTLNTLVYICTRCSKKRNPGFNFAITSANVHRF